MLLEKDDLNFRLLDVLRFTEKDNRTKVRARSFCALSLRLVGDTYIDIQNKTVHLSGGDLALFPANTPYTRRTKCDEMIVFHFNLQDLPSYEFEVMHLEPHELEEIKPHFEKALSEWREKRTGYRYRATAELCEVFAITCQRADNVKFDNASSSVMAVTISESVDYIRQHYGDADLSVAKLALRAHVSERYLRRLFVQELGVSPKRYINDLRLEQAQALLNTGYDKVSAVAAKVGFCDPKYFATAFKRRFGYPPSAQEYTPINSK
jgi:AraC-like DNA-binding protein